MKLARYTKGLQEALTSSRFHSIANLCLAVTVLFMAGMAFKQRERIVLVPQQLDERMTVAYQWASEGYYKKFALSTALLIGNANQANAGFVADQLAVVFAPALYDAVRTKILEDAEEMKQTGRSLRFLPRGITYERETNKVFVEGKQEIISATKQVTELNMVYEMVVQISSGVPSIAHFTSYQGLAKTQANLARMGGKTSAQ